jgi:hypothetical protein
MRRAAQTVREMRERTELKVGAAGRCMLALKALENN